MNSSTPDNTRALAAKVVTSLLDGAEPNGAQPRDLGPWRDIVSSMYDAFGMDGTPGARAAWERQIKADPTLRTLLLSDPTPKKPTGNAPALPEAATAIYQHEAPCGQLVDDYVQHAYEAAPLVPRSFHELAALTLISATIARRLCLNLQDRAIYPNMYGMFVGPSSLYAKTTALSVAERVMERAGISHLLVTPQSTPQALARSMSYDIEPPARLSGERLAEWLRERAFAAQRLMLMDEASGLFSGFGREYNTGLLELILQLYDGRNRLAVNSTITHGDTVLTDTLISFFGCSTPPEMAAHFSNSRMWANGMWARFVLLVPDEPPKRLFYQDSSYLENPIGPVAAAFQALYELFPVPEAHIVTEEIESESKGGKGRPRKETITRVERSNVHAPSHVTLTPGVFSAWRDYSLALRYDMFYPEQGVISAELQPNYSRFSDMTMKIAMIYAAADATSLPIRVELRHYARAQRTVEKYRASLHNLTAEHMKTDDESLAERIIRLLERKHALTAREIGQHAHTPAKVVTEALLTLQASGQVEAVSVGRATKYTLVS